MEKPHDSHSNLQNVQSLSYTHTYKQYTPTYRNRFASNRITINRPLGQGSSSSQRTRTGCKLTSASPDEKQKTSFQRSLSKQYHFQLFVYFCLCFQTQQWTVAYYAHKNRVIASFETESIEYVWNWKLRPWFWDGTKHETVTSRTSGEWLNARFNH